MDAVGSQVAGKSQVIVHDQRHPMGPAYFQEEGCFLLTAGRILLSFVPILDDPCAAQDGSLHRRLQVPTCQ
jgi:hypothetical protein